MTTMTPHEPAPQPALEPDLKTGPATGAETGREVGPGEVVGGVDTHRDTHVAVVLDHLGRRLGTAAFDAAEHGYLELVEWMSGFGVVAMVGIEGTGSYGAGLARHLAAHTDVELVEIDRPDRSTRRRKGKSDPIDAEAAARTAMTTTTSTTTSGTMPGTMSGTLGTVPKIRSGRVESLRNLRVARRSAVQQRADVLRQMKSLIVTAPDALRAELRTLTNPQLITRCTALRPDPTHLEDPTQAVKTSLRHLARRHRHLSSEITDLDDLIEPLVRAINARLLDLNGVGPDTAAQLLVTAGENPTRMRSEAAFAMLCGTAPIPASSGQTRRMRLNRGGDRQANAALYRTTLSRLRWDPATKAYAERRTTQDHLTKKETIRCLKRYITREIYTALTTPNPT